MLLPPLQHGETWHCSGFEGQWHYPQRSGTQPVLMLRMYWPSEKNPSILNGSWTIPAVKKMR